MRLIKNDSFIRKYIKKRETLMDKFLIKTEKIEKKNPQILRNVIPYMVKSKKRSNPKACERQSV